MNVPVSIEFMVRSTFHKIWPKKLFFFSYLTLFGVCVSIQVSLMNVNDVTTSNCGRHSQIASIVCRSLQLLTRKSSAVMVVWAQIYKTWSKSEESFDLLTFQTQAFYVIFYGVIQIKKSRYAKCQEISKLFEKLINKLKRPDYDLIDGFSGWITGLGWEWSRCELHIRCRCCITILADARFGTDMPWTSGTSCY